MPDISVEVLGLKELEKALLDLGAETGYKTLRAAARKSMKPVEAAAIAGANEDTGDLKKSIGIQTKKGKGKSTAVTVNVGSVRRSISEGEKGSKTRRKLNKQDAKVAAQEYGTSKQQADPFLRPALENNAGTVLSHFKTELAKAIDRAVKRAKKVKA